MRTRNTIAILAAFVLGVGVVLFLGFAFTGELADGWDSGDSITGDNADEIDAALDLAEEYCVSKTILSPTGGETVDMLDFGHPTGTTTVTRVSCAVEYGSGETVDATAYEVDADGDPVSQVAIEATMTCDDDGLIVSSGIDNAGIDAGDRLRWVLDTPTGVVDQWVGSICVTRTSQ